jgi:gluconolactonase
VIYVEDLGSPEGPVALSDGGWLVVEMAPDRGCVTHLTGQGRREPLARTGRPNGLAVDRSGLIWVAESSPPGLLRMTMEGQYETVSDTIDGIQLLFPNDLCFGPDGMLYLTDSGIRADEWMPNGTVRSDYGTVPIEGRVYRVDPTTLEGVALADGIRFTNGLAFGPADEYLYVAETVTGDILRYRWSPEGLGPREVFANVTDNARMVGQGGPDGMAFGSDGSLYVAVTGQGDVSVVRPDGSIDARIRTHGNKPTNVAFGRSPESRIYVTEVENGTLEVFDVPTDGLPLHR